MQASLEASSKSHKRAQQPAAQKAEHAQHELGVAKRECERSAGDAEDRKVQLSVLVETVETLQAGNVGEASKKNGLLLAPCCAMHGFTVAGWSLSAWFGLTESVKRGMYAHTLCTVVRTVGRYLLSIAGEKEQRIVSLTAQLTTAYMKQAVAERR